MSARTRRLAALGAAATAVAWAVAGARWAGVPLALVLVGAAALAGAGGRLVVEAPYLAPWGRLTATVRRLRERVGR